MTSFLSEHPHRRLNILTGEWILVSPHRAKRPWQGQVEKAQTEQRPVYDAHCYLCPGNERVGGLKNPKYDSTFVFTNDFSALLPEHSPEVLNQGGLLRAERESGICRVVCFSPRHDLTLPDMSIEQIANVVAVWTDEYAALGAQEHIQYVQIFENKGAVMGCSNPHPHGQIWAQQSIPMEPAKEIVQSEKYFREKGNCLLCDYLALERSLGERIVCENVHFTALVPFWAVWPFETLILSRRHLDALPNMSNAERQAFADIMKRLTLRYDNLFQVSFPYSSGIHQSPTDGAAHPEQHLHMHFYPPLLRSATVKKFMVGYEMLANPQRDITAELSAIRLHEIGE
jgi:UDPglucose--hexose-1-phosphate uridylyltransferase